MSSAVCTIVEAPAPANEALKALVALLDLQVDIVDSVDGSSSDFCKLVSTQVDPFAVSAEFATRRTICTIVGWPAVVAHLCRHTVLWNNKSVDIDALQQEWIQQAANAVLDLSGA